MEATIAATILNSNIASNLDEHGAECLLAGSAVGRNLKFTFKITDTIAISANIYVRSDSELVTNDDGSVWSSAKLVPQVSFVMYDLPVSFVADAMRFYDELAALSQALISLCVEPLVKCISTAEEAAAVAVEKQKIAEENRKVAALSEIIRAGGKGLRTGGNAKLVDRPSIDAIPNGTYIQNSYWDGKATHTYKIEVVDDGAFIRRIPTV